MKPLVRFTLEGEPVPKARPRVLRNGHVYTPKRTVDYETALRLAARAAFFVYPTDQKGLVVSALFGRTAMRGDLDNLLKSLLDAMQGIIYVDDRQVWGFKDVAQFRAETPFTEATVWAGEGS